MDINPNAIINALADPTLVIDAEDRFAYINQAAEQFFARSAGSLIGRSVSDILPEDSAVLALVRQARTTQSSISQYGITLEGPRIGSHLVSIDVSPITETPGSVVITMQERSIARKLDHQLVHRNAARSVTAMAGMLAHEVKNPLSGIRGAAQLLELSAAEDDRELTRLICEEADRIVALVDRMEMFSDDRPIERTAVNIHEVLEHVRKVAASGFARGIRFVESYDPSLPPVYGNRDLLIQALLNLVKNASEALPEEGGEIHLSTRYQQGVRLAVPGSDARVDLPLLVSVGDNGPGIPEDLKPHLFDPFVTTKTNGKGLGLALVAKIVGDHGGVIDLDSDSQGTVFRMNLPKAPTNAAAKREPQTEEASK
ncbi:MAG: ATP-binding protein [Rhodovibrionaceae bacterium]|nr:ATP-binding protein [Rhodovibrionaceae bacterium]